ncbi:MAG: SpoIID/LytB domain-containing protein [Gemmatimonadaceae bacterium]|nr:SpoIID/LytB domain-containing protein [Gemmatimonadaceae bacterium]
MRGRAGRTVGAAALAIVAACGALVPAPSPPEPEAALPPLVIPPGEVAAVPPRPAADSLREDERVPSPRPRVERSAVADDAPPRVRVALRTAANRVQVGAEGAVRFVDADGRYVAGGEGRVWTIESRPGALRLVGDGGAASAWRTGTIEAVAGGAAPLRVDGRRYRGRLRLVPTDSGLAVVNMLGLEAYLRGVVPREIGPRTAAEAAAVEAQAIAARSYTVVRLRETSGRPWDVVGTVLNQAYGGVDAETPVADDAVAATAGLVLLYDGKVINATFHAACGGRTATAPELWRTRGEPWLVSVDDTDPATGRPYCERSPRFRWTARYTADQLQTLATRWLAQYGGAPTGGLGRVHGVRIAGRTPTGRVASVAFTTDRGTYTVRANDVRFVLRSANGELLNSTSFDVAGPDGSGGIELNGHGHGHGVGMCQWGAIGRARAGQDARTILRTYFPGTTIGAAPAARGP